MRKALRLKKLYQSPRFCEDFTYDGGDLGVICSHEETRFALWSPLAKSVSLLLYRDGESSPILEELPMERTERGVWRYRFPRSLHGLYYAYRIRHRDGESISGDPYARACGLNSQRCMVVDLRRTDPPGWDRDRPPQRPPENIIYELHVKEFSWQEAGGFPPEHRGKYTAFTCGHTTLHGDGLHPTGIDYLKELGVTYIQLMPIFDYGSVDDLSPDDFNWGYDPIYYNIPEGSYSSDPRRGEVRIRECKAMIQALHQAGFRVIMDVVYNHTYHLDLPFNRTVPWYYYRTDSRGLPSNGSGCGCDVASERPMCARYILDSVLYWAQEYHIDGFRFDLMGLMDVALMERIRKALDDCFGRGEKLIFGEPWAAAHTSMAKGSLPAVKRNIALLDQDVGMFCDDTRDAIKGHVFYRDRPGFVTGAPGLEKAILNGARAWCGVGPGAKAPSQIVTYVSSHDDLTLWDKLGAVVPDEEDRLRRNRLAAAICATSQGSLFLLSGEEAARTKDGHSNTYNKSIALNRLDWERAYAYTPLREYYSGLFALRKLCPGLCDKSPQAAERFHHTWYKEGAAGFCLDNSGGASPWDTLCVIYAAGPEGVRHELLPGSWEILADGESSFLWKAPGTVSGEIFVPPVSALILGRPAQ